MSTSGTTSLGRLSLGLPLLYTTSIACSQNIVLQSHITNSAVDQQIFTPVEGVTRNVSGAAGPLEQ